MRSVNERLLRVYLLHLAGRIDGQTCADAFRGIRPRYPEPPPAPALSCAAPPRRPRDRRECA
ncbi:hypothetical protein [Actinomadura miaoliensis]|uniref:Uncharacterized protein n=1 Tax=Actinomadura miaoliensis TaxID=430685 RepID=A0ABP7X5K3_9ACTN